MKLSLVQILMVLSAVGLFGFVIGNPLVMLIGLLGFVGCAGWTLLMMRYVQRSAMYFEQNRYEEAEHELRQALRFSGQVFDGLLYSNLAAVLSRQGRDDRAVKILDKLIEHHADDGVVYNNRAYVLAAMDLLEASLDDGNRAVALLPAYPNAYGTRGHTYFLLGEHERALADFIKSAELKPDHTFAIAGQAITQHASGDVEAARTTWERLMRLDARYATAETLAEDWNPAEDFVDEARKLVAGLKNKAQG